MRHEEFTGQVQARARLDSRGAAETATRATLETLAERVPPSLAENLAAQLPREIGEHLRRVAHAPDLPDTGVRMSRTEFYERVARRAATSPSRAMREARSVIEVTNEATVGTLPQKIFQSLDADLADDLFAGSSGPAWAE